MTLNVLTLTVMSYAPIPKLFSQWGNSVSYIPFCMNEMYSWFSGK